QNRSQEHQGQCPGGQQGDPRCRREVGQVILPLPRSTSAQRGSEGPVCVGKRSVRRQFRVRSAAPLWVAATKPKRRWTPHSKKPRRHGRTKEPGFFNPKQCGPPHGPPWSGGS